MRPAGNLPQKAGAALKALSLLASVALVGCVQAPKPMYEWGSYQGQVYEHFKSDGSGPLQQLQALEAQAQAAASKGMLLPPGFRAHLGLVNLKLGRDDDARRNFEAEKASFPESTVYMDSLLKRMSEKKS